MSSITISVIFLLLISYATGAHKYTPRTCRANMKTCLKRDSTQQCTLMYYECIRRYCRIQSQYRKTITRATKTWMACLVKHGVLIMLDGHTTDALVE
ncbi:hypothetical protein ScPMuIL_003265 [Solemya velum]